MGAAATVRSLGAGCGSAGPRARPRSPRASLDVPRRTGISAGADRPAGGIARTPEAVAAGLVAATSRPRPERPPRVVGEALGPADREVRRAWVARARRGVVDEDVDRGGGDQADPGDRQRRARVASRLHAPCSHFSPDHSVHLLSICSHTPPPAAAATPGGRRSSARKDLGSRSQSAPRAAARRRSAAAAGACRAPARRPRGRAPAPVRRRRRWLGAIAIERQLRRRRRPRRGPGTRLRTAPAPGPARGSAPGARCASPARPLPGRALRRAPGGGPTPPRSSRRSSAAPASAPPPRRRRATHPRALSIGARRGPGRGLGGGAKPAPPLASGGRQLDVAAAEPGAAWPPRRRPPLQHRLWAAARTRPAAARDDRLQQQPRVPR